MTKTRIVLVALSALSLLAVPAFARPHDGDRDGDDHDHDRDRDWRHHQGPAVVVDQGDTLGDIDHALQEMQSLSDRLGDVRDRRLRDELRDRVSRLERDLQDERDDVADARPVDRIQQPPPVVVAPPPVGPVPMSDARFQEVRDAIAQAYYTPQKYAVIQSVARDNWFTVDQVVVVMNDLYWNTDKVKAAAMLYPKVVDKQDWFKVYGALYFDSDKDALRRQTEEAMR